MWDTLGGALPVDCRPLVHGSPALARPGSGVIIAPAFGTAYLNRVPEAHIETAIQAGCHRNREQSTGQRNSTETEFGPWWLFENWAKGEIGCLIDTYAALESA